MVDFPGGARVGDVAVMPLSDGGFGACQVGSVESTTIAVYALDWHSAQPPTLAQLEDVGPLVLDHHAYGGEHAHINIDSSEPVPPSFDWIGNQPVRADVPESSSSFSGWFYLSLQVVSQRRWDREMPADTKAAYRAGLTSGPVRVDFGGGPTTIGSATSTLDLTAVVPAGEVRWSALDSLPRCTTLTWAGPDRGLSDALADRPIVSSLEWRDAPPDIDLAGSALSNLTLHGSAVRTLVVPRTLAFLQLDGQTELFVVRAADDGRWIRLSVDATGPDVVVPSGVEQVRHVVLHVDGVVSAASLSGLVGLETLTIRWRKPPHRLTDAAALGGLEHLHGVDLVNAYGVDADTLPDLPALTTLEVNGLPKSVVAPLKARYRRTGVRLVVRGAKTDSWLAANIGNPFREWVDDDARGGAVACKAYATALGALDRLPADAPDRLDQVRQILRGLVDRLNEVEDKYELIDTVRREEAGEAFVDLCLRHGVPAELADSWFDDWRSF